MPVNARTATPADATIESGTVVIAASAVVTEAIADAVTLMTDRVETYLKTGGAAAAVVIVAIAETVEIVIEESASAAPHPRAERSLLLT